MLKKLLIGSLLVVGVQLMLASVLFAQDEARYRKKTIIDFEDVLLEGELKNPAGAYITERRELNFKNLIQTRTNFEQEMVKSVDVLK